MPSVSKIQQAAAGAALSAKRGDKAADTLYGASKSMYKSMSSDQLGHFAGTRHKGLPHKKALVGMNTQGTTNSVGQPTPKACLSLEDAGTAIVDHLLDEDNEQAEVSTAQNILAALGRLQSSLPNATPEQQHDLTTIRAAARTLVRMHGVT